MKPEKERPNLLLCGHGYLGREIASVFRHAGWDVTALSLSGPARPDLGCGAPQEGVLGSAGGRLAEIACDVSQPDQVTDLAKRIPPPTSVVHCASSSRGGADTYRQVYLAGCRNLLAGFPGVPLLFTSSTSVYAQTDGSEVTEESPAEPERETGQVLLATERAVLEGGGLVCRLAGIYGPHRSVILKKLLTGKAVVEEDGRRFLNQVHRNDAARAILHLARLTRTEAGSPHRLFNLTDSRPLSQLECYTALAEMFDRALPPTGPRDPNRKRGWTHKRVSNSRLRAAGWQPEFPSFLDAADQIAPTLDLS